jgi:predicted house-cleaning noncanonical NTP pyrophosphatase (MazG superfamily)
LEEQLEVFSVSIPPPLHFQLIIGPGGRRNVIPGAIMFAIFGATGQAMYNWTDARNSERVEKGGVHKNSIFNSKWSPMKVLSDREYEDMLREKLLRVNAQIALVDENIEALRAQERQLTAEDEKKLKDRKDASS